MEGARGKLKPYSGEVRRSNDKPHVSCCLGCGVPPLSMFGVAPITLCEYTRGDMARNLGSFFRVSHTRIIFCSATYHVASNPLSLRHRPNDIKKQVILVERIATVDSIWAQVGPLPINYLPISNVCSAICMLFLSSNGDSCTNSHHLPPLVAFVLSMAIPPHPEDDWLSIAAIFVHFCRVANRDDRPTSVHIVWQTANEQGFPSRKRPLILVDEVLTSIQARSAQLEINESARDCRSAGPSPTHVAVFLMQNVEAQLDAVAGRSWRLLNIPTEPPTQATGEMDAPSSAPFPRCQCSALIPSF